MYKTALGAAPFNTETTREVGGGAWSRAPWQQLPSPRNTENCRETPLGVGVGDQANSLCLVQVSSGKGLGSEALPQWRLERSPQS